MAPRSPIVSLAIYGLDGGNAKSFAPLRWRRGCGCVRRTSAAPRRPTDCPSSWPSTPARCDERVWGLPVLTVAGPPCMAPTLRCLRGILSAWGALLPRSWLSLCGAEIPPRCGSKSLSAAAAAHVSWNYVCHVAACARSKCEMPAAQVEHTLHVCFQLLSAESSQRKQEHSGQDKTVPSAHPWF